MRHARAELAVRVLVDYEHRVDPRRRPCLVHVRVEAEAWRANHEDSCTSLTATGVTSKKSRKDEDLQETVPC